MKSQSNLALSEAGLTRIVRRRALRHPITLSAAATATLAAVAMPFIELALGFGVMTFALVLGFGFVAHYQRTTRGAVAREIVDASLKASSRARAETLGRLRAQLFDLSEEDPVIGTPAARALEQYQRLRQHADGFAELLATKLNVGELTYVRYFSAVDTLEESIMNNLVSVADRLRVVSHRSPSPAANIDGRAGQSEDTAFMGTIVSELEHNDAALIALNDLHLAVARMRSLDDYAKADVSELVAELERLAENAERFR